MNKEDVRLRAAVKRMTLEAGMSYTDPITGNEPKRKSGWEIGFWFNVQ
jgi:hypothetical protein